MLYVAAFVWNHLRVRADRRDEAPEQRVRRDRRSDAGMLAQFAAVVLALSVRRSGAVPFPMTMVAAVALYGGVVLTWAALANLGRQWRLAAVVADDHALVTGGPYSVVRHPVYTGFFLMLVGSALLESQWWAGIVAVILHVAGTEVRIAAEEGLLGQHFGPAFDRYKSATHAWLPPIR